MDKVILTAAMDAIYAVAPDVIILPSTGGAVGMSAEERLQPTELMPEIATLDCGTCNFGVFGIFDNTIPMIKQFGKRMAENHIKPEYECFEQGMIDTTLELTEKGFLPADDMHFNLVLGVKGTMAASARNLAFMVDSLPKDATWCATGIGRGEFPVAAVALAMGGHVRVGFEDNLYLAKGVKAPSNGALVEKAVSMARLLGREPATPDEARAMLHLMK
jgi:3-keto-5-aminohexanoate cleavage enzyme